MSSVVVYGASGYIGRYVAFALREAGYRVYGVIRKSDFAPMLLQNEILPIILPDINQPTEEFKNAVNEAISVVDTSGMDQNIIKYLVELNKTEKNRNYQHQYIGTSGILLHADSPALAVERTRPVVPANFPIPGLLERAQAEDVITTNESFKGNIIRPGGVYGLDGNVSGGIPETRFLQTAFSIGKNDDLHIYGNPHKPYSVVHVKDLAAAYVLLVETGAHGKLYDVAAEYVDYEQLQVDAAEAAGWRGQIKYVDVKNLRPEQFFLKLTDVSIRVTGEKARRELGWKPKRTGLLHEVDIYYRAFKAQRDASKVETKY